MRNTLSRATLVMLAILSHAYAQVTPYYQTHFPPEEFQVRWQKVFDKIGDRAIVIVPEKLVGQGGLLQKLPPVPENAAPLRR